MAHPIRPGVVIEMNNTVTVYEKGSEVIRMLHTLLGEKFQVGCASISRVTMVRQLPASNLCKRWRASGRDLQQFRRWYSQAGT